MILPDMAFNGYSRYYDLLYQDKDYIGETNYILETLNKQGITQGDILEFGSGTGRHGNLLSKRGYKVHGIERSAEMASRATVGNGFTCQEGNICSVQLGRTFDAVLSLFHVISYQTSNSDLTAVFARAQEHLLSGGVFIFDFWYSPAVFTQRPTVRVKRMEDEEIEITRLAEPTVWPNENTVDVHYTIFARQKTSGTMQITTEVHSMRHFSLPEIDLLANQNGFERIGAEEFLSGKPAGNDTWGVCVTLQKL
jgi:SAM-dependent methyltransferase